MLAFACSSCSKVASATAHAHAHMTPTHRHLRLACTCMCACALERQLHNLGNRIWFCHFFAFSISYPEKRPFFGMTRKMVLDPFAPACSCLLQSCKRKCTCTCAHDTHPPRLFWEFFFKILCTLHPATRVGSHAEKNKKRFA